jgi:hypothetical protein
VNNDSIDTWAVSKVKRVKRRKVCKYMIPQNKAYRGETAERLARQSERALPVGQGRLAGYSVFRERFGDTMQLEKSLFRGRKSSPRDSLFICSPKESGCDCSVRGSSDDLLEAGIR